MKGKFLKLTSVLLGLVYLISSGKALIWLVAADDDDLDVSNFSQIIKNFSDFDSASKVSADYWFEKLVGASKDIKNYEPYVGSLDTQILNDVKRIPTDKCGISSIPIISNSLGRILHKYHYVKHKDIKYNQGYFYILCMIYSKFLRTRNMYSAVTIEDEARVYFIYSRFMKLIGALLNDTQDWGKTSREYIEKFLNSNIIDSDYKKDMVKNFFLDEEIMFLLKGFGSCGIKLLTFKDCEKIWDYIIINDKIFIAPGDGFKKNETLDAVNCIIIYSYLKLKYNKFNEVFALI